MEDLSDNEKLISLYPEYDPDPDVIYPYTPGLDNSSVRCICSVPFDDGATIQCDGCWVWQHMVCMEIDRSDIPSVYYCEECRERPVNVDKAVTNQAKMQKQRRVERVSVIKEILIKKGIIDKPSPRKKKESRGRKVLASPKRQSKPASIKQAGGTKISSLSLEHPSPLGNNANSRSGIGAVPEFPFRNIVCLDDWTDGFLGRAPEKIKKSCLENPLAAEYADWAINCASVQGHQFVGETGKQVIDFIQKYETVAKFWDGGPLPFEIPGVVQDVTNSNDHIDDSTIFKLETSSMAGEIDKNVQFSKLPDILDDVPAVQVEVKDEITDSISDGVVEHSISKDYADESMEKEMDIDNNLITPNDDMDTYVAIIRTEESVTQKPCSAPTFNMEGKVLVSDNEGPTNTDTTDDLNASTIAQKNHNEEYQKFAASIVVTTRKVLRTAPVRYSVDLIPINGENQIPYYGLFSTCRIPPHSFICSTFGTLSEISHLPSSLLPSKVTDDIYTLPPFTLKVLQNKDWILDSRTRGDMSGRYVRRSINPSQSNANIHCLIVKDELIMSEKLVFGIFSSKEISQGEEIILSTPGSHAYPCTCERGSNCTDKDYFGNISNEYSVADRPSSVDKKEVKLTGKLVKNCNIKRKLPLFLRVLVLSHQKKIKALKAEKIQDLPVIVSAPAKNLAVHATREVVAPPASTKNPAVNIPRRKPPPSPVVESPKALSREERKLKEQLALFEKMEQQDKKKRKRRTHGEHFTETASPMSKRESEDSAEDNYTVSSSKIDNETSESVGRDSPASVTDLVDRHMDESDSKRKHETQTVPESLVFKKPKLEKLEKDAQSTPAPLVRKLSLKDFLQKRSQNKTPSPSSSGLFFPTDDSAT